MRYDSGVKPSREVDATHEFRLQIVWTLGAIGLDAAEQSQLVIRRLLVDTANEIIERKRRQAAPLRPGVRVVPFQTGSPEWRAMMGPVNLVSEGKIMSKEHSEQTLEMPFPLTLDVHAVRLSDEQFYRLCQDNRDLRMELTAQGELIIMPPTGSKTGWRNAKIIHRLTAWAEKDGTGLTFDSSTGFALSNGAKRSPDAAWVRRERWEALTEEEQEGFAPLCPDFVLELRSPEDSLSTLQDKMLEYMANGAQLGWLVDPKARRIYVYRQGQLPECLENPETMVGDPVLRGFVLDLRDIW